jgi:hypothetical protein
MMAGVLKVRSGSNWVPVDPFVRVPGPVPTAGQTGQLLTKKSNADGDVQWAGPSRGQYTADSTWHEVGTAGEPAFTNAWANYGAQFNTTAFRVDADGWVYMKGLVRSGTINTAIFTLPAAYRPWRNVYFPVMCANFTAYCQINASDGTVVAYVMGGSNAWFSLETVRFPIWNNWGAFAGKYQPLEGLDERPVAVGSEYAIGLWPQTNGMVRVHGINGMLPAAGLLSSLNDINLGIFTYMIGVGTNDTAGGRAITISKRFGFYSNGPAGSANGWTMVSSEYGRMGVEDQWISPTLQNSWAVYAPAASNWHTPAGYWKDANGVVHLRGMMTGGSSATAPFFTLPAGYRPAAVVLWYASSGSGAACRVDVQGDGQVVPVIGANTGWTSLDGINFYAAGA